MQLNKKYRNRNAQNAVKSIATSRTGIPSSFAVKLLRFSLPRYWIIPSSSFEVSNFRVLRLNVELACFFISVHIGDFILLEVTDFRLSKTMIANSINALTTKPREHNK